MTTIPEITPWKKNELIAFRFFFIYFLIQALPLDGQFFNALFSINWFHPYYGDIFTLAHYEPHFLSGAASYADWGIIALIAVAGAIIWTRLDTQRTAYNALYYWLRVILRYRLALAIFGYGFIKLFPLLAPYPSISNLNTQYGDFTRWKLFSLSLGVVPSYESFLGLIEIISAFLLLFRKTAATGALFIFIFLGNVFMSNLAYEGGEDVYSLYLISIALFLLAFDVQRIVRLLVLQKPTAPNRYRPALSSQWQRYAKTALKAAFILFFVALYGFSARQGYHHDPYQFPAAKGLPGVSGIYNVAAFRLNHDSLPYSKTDPVRWQDVVFEKWATISIRSNRPVILDSNNRDRISRDEKDRNYELEGSAGRHYYSYEYDSLNHVLRLQNRNRHYPNDQWLLHYSSRQDSIILSGTNENKDSVYVVLNKINKKYLLEEVSRLGRQKSLKL